MSDETVSEFMYVPEMARLIGISEQALRGAVARDAKWLPEYIHLGRKLAWRRKVVRLWLETGEKGGRR